MQFWALIVDSFRESLDRKIFWVLLAITLLIALIMASVGFEGEQISFMFGLWSTKTEQFNPLSDLGRANLIGFTVYFLASTVMGWIGVMLMVIATAGTFPTFMQHGAVDVVLAKPISRARLFLYKYASGMVFVVLQAAVFFGLTFLIMWMRWGVFAPGYLGCVVLMVLLFSYIYCVSVLVAIKTRSTVAAILVSLFCWVLFALVHQAPALFEAFPDLKERRTLYTTVRVVSWIPPKTGDFPYIAAKWAQAGTSIDAMPFFAATVNNDVDRTEIEQARDVERRELNKNHLYSIGSSLLFEAVIVLWAMAAFSRRDY